MHRLIDANKINFENSEFDTYSDYSKSFDAIDFAPTVLEIPDNPTNGDMIKAMFPNVTVRDSYYTYAVEVKLEYHSQHDTGLLFDKKWWNAPYKMESEDNK